MPLLHGMFQKYEISVPIASKFPVLACHILMTWFEGDIFLPTCPLAWSMSTSKIMQKKKKKTLDYK